VEPVRAREEAMHMAAAVRQLERHLTPVSTDPDPKEVVAVVLADGSIRDLRARSAAVPARRIDMGTISGSDWVLWWNRRSFAND
jgi:hypothetical protein